jgi:hypothetical protein
MTTQSPVVFADAFEDANKSFVQNKTRVAKDSDLFFKHVSLKPADHDYAR